MARLLVTANAFLTCTHKIGIVRQRASQQYVRIIGNPILVDPDTVGKAITGCPIPIAADPLDFERA